MNGGETMVTVETYGVLEDLQKTEIDASEGSFKTLMKSYEEVVMKSLITAFGLDFIMIKDRYGGDVDTIHNVRAMQQEKNLPDSQKKFSGYANQQNQQEYENITPYNTKNEKGQKIIADKYHQHANYKERNKQASEQKKAGTLKDSYSGNKIAPNGKVDLDHTISAKEIHEDAGRVLAGIDGVELANKDTNLNHTDPSINRPKQAKSVNKFLNDLKQNENERQKAIKELRSKPDLTDKERAKLNKLEKLSSIDQEKIKKADQKAREAYEKEIASTYYTSKKFMNDTLKASYKKGMQMGLRQALGTILTATWMCIREEVPKLVVKMKANFDLSTFFNGLIDIIEAAFKRVQEMYKEVIQSFSNGILSGILSSIVSTLVNIFTTTSKNVGKIIRECWSSIVEALNILLFNPKNLPFGDVVKSVMVIIATASSVVLGTVVSEAMSKIPALKIPIIGEILPQFIGALVTGLMSVSLLYFLDHSKMVQKLVAWMNKLKTQLDYKIEYYKQVYEEVCQYAAQLVEIDLQEFKAKATLAQEIGEKLSRPMSTYQMNVELTQLVQQLNINLAYDGTIAGLDSFMNNKEEVLKFSL